jgi:hypothetical protein
MRQKIATAFALAVVSVFAAPAGADVTRPGSILIFPVWKSDNGAFTLVSVTNTHTGKQTYVHYQYPTTTPNPQNPFRPLDCNVLNSFAVLTPADTLTVNVACHNAQALNSGGGFLVCTAWSPSGGPWAHDYLAGSALIVSASGAKQAIEAIPFEAIPASGSTEKNGDGKTNFDGLEYEAISDELILDNFVPLANPSLAILSLTGHGQDVHKLQFRVWNDNEFQLSTTLSFNCWFYQPLSKISSLFTQAYLASTPDDPKEVDINCNQVNAFEVGWALIDSIGVTNPGGGSVSNDGAILGAIVAGDGQRAFGGGYTLWGTHAVQTNGAFGH